MRLCVFCDQPFTPESDDDAFCQRCDDRLIVCEIVVDNLAKQLSDTHQPETK